MANLRKLPLKLFGSGPIREFKNVASDVVLVEVKGKVFRGLTVNQAWKINHKENGQTITKITREKVAEHAIRGISLIGDSVTTKKSVARFFAEEKGIVLVLDAAKCGKMVHVGKTLNIVDWEEELIADGIPAKAVLGYLLPGDKEKATPEDVVEIIPVESTPEEASQIAKLSN